MRNIHMTFNDRLEIERGLKMNESLTEISKSIDKVVGTVRNEIINHQIKKYPSNFNGRRNLCKFYSNNECQIKKLCSINNCTNFCKNCFRHSCNNLCSNFEEYTCEHLQHKPYCCNGCNSRANCHNIKMYYYAKDADIEYHKSLSNSRKGPRITKEELTYINTEIVPLVKNGQSFEHIIMSDNNITICKQTLYNYTDKKYINLSNIDLPKKATYKKRETNNDKNLIEKNQSKIDELKATRNYDKFKLFVKIHPNFKIAEMDTVIGRIGGKVLLTLILRDSNFMIAFLLEDKKAITVNNKLTELKKILSPTIFKILFRILLTDNGVEFNLIEEIEKLETDQKINLFFCDPGKSSQKSKIEKNHVEIRKILPKGTSFDNLTQDDINIMMSHINSYKRKKLGGKSPIEIIENNYGLELLELLNYKKIDSKNIILKPSLLEHKLSKDT